MSKYVPALAATLIVSLGALLMAAAPTPTPPIANPTPFPTATAPAGATRIRLWKTTPNVVDGPDADGNPTEPTLDLYVPPAEKAPSGGFASVVILPGGGYTNLSTDNEG